MQLKLHKKEQFEKQQKQPMIPWKIKSQESQKLLPK